MKKIQVIFFSLIVILSIQNVSAQTLKKCNQSDAYQKYMNLSTEEKKHTMIPNYCAEIEKNNKENTAKDFMDIATSSYLDSSYDARDDGIITNVQNQYNYGTCWAFSGIAAIEANANKNNIKNGNASYDFSERHMVFSLISGGYSDEAGKKGKYYSLNLDGGRITYVPTYYFNNGGQLLEEEYPYLETMNKITKSQFPKGRNIVTITDFGYENIEEYGICTQNNITNIKKKIIEYGAVQATIHMDDPTFFKDKTTKDYYLATSNYNRVINHGVTIVGWDDEISKNNFNGATRNGAWIVKNSWGNDWSSDGYFYVSYDDHFICKNMAYYGGVSHTTFDYSYKASDVLGYLEILFKNQVAFSSTFTKESLETEKLKRVSFAVSENSSYNVYLSKSNTYENNNDWVLLGSGTSDHYGITSMDIDSNQIINDDFTIIVKYTIDEGEEVPIFTMCNDGDLEDLSKMEISSGKNFYTLNGTTWKDMKKMQLGTYSSISCEPSIYAYTDETETVYEMNDVAVMDNSAEIKLNAPIAAINSASYTVRNSEDTDVTSKFTIGYNNAKKKLIVKSDNTISGEFTIYGESRGLNSSITFELEQKVQLNNSTSVQFSNHQVIVSPRKNVTNSFKNIFSGSSIYNVPVTIYDNSGNEVNSNASLQTDAVVDINGVSYNIIVLGDINKDGSINSGDLLKIRQHLLIINELTESAKLAADMNKDNLVNSGDLLKMRQYLLS